MWCALIFLTWKVDESDQRCNKKSSPYQRNSLKYFYLWNLFERSSKNKNANLRTFAPVLLFFKQVAEYVIRKICFVLTWPDVLII